MEDYSKRTEIYYGKIPTDKEIDAMPEEKDFDEYLSQETEKVEEESPAQWAPCPWCAKAKTDRPELICQGCKKTPSELEEYLPENTGEDVNPDDYVWDNEGTLNTENGHFLCTECYILVGMPVSSKGWTCP